ncbi:NAD(P)/FAD-dependent oxidoreductase [Streptomyces coeruleorubidus]|uniref:NAD(P)/FAD-dependent oxidoreductase n=1 Tax=Streptomyces coeruleorubidus TaxID=116188 RepID=UPI0033B0AC0D
MPSNIVVVGGSVAGVEALLALRSAGYDGRLTLVGADPELPYNPTPLSKELLSGEMDEDDIRLLPEEEFDDLDVNLLLGTPAQALHLGSRTVRVGGSLLAYDGLIIATGSEAVRPQGWFGLDGVHTLRTLDDARRVRQAMSTGSPSVVVVGAGFIGCEIAAAARHFGLDVTLVEAAPTALQRAVPAHLAAPVVSLQRANGVRVVCGVGVAGILGSERVDKVEFTDGTVLDADLVVVGVGAVPATRWLADSGLAVDDGVITDATLRTTAPGVYAVGDAARWPHPGTGGSIRVEHWTNAREQGKRAALNLLDPEAAQPYAGVPYVWSDLFGKRFQLAGTAHAEHVHFLDGGPAAESYLALLGDGSRVVGAVGFGGSPRPFNQARRLVAAGAPWHEAVSQHE